MTGHVRFTPLETPSAAKLTALSDYLTHTFTDAAQRLAQWPAPPAGARSILTTDPGTLWGYDGSRWWPVLGPGGRDTASVTTATRVGWNELAPGLMLAARFDHGRRYRAWGDLWWTADDDLTAQNVQLDLAVISPTTTALLERIGARRGIIGDPAVLGGDNQAIPFEVDYLCRAPFANVGACRYSIWIRAGFFPLTVELTRLTVEDLGPIPPAWPLPD